MSIEWMVQFLSAAVVAAVPLLLATVGETITERSGSINLGVEGMMYMGAVIGFSVGLATASPLLAFLGAALAGVVGSLIFGLLTITLKANQIVCGLTLTLFGTGFAGYVGTSMVGVQAPQSILQAFAPRRIPLLADIPLLGEILFDQDILVYASMLIVAVAGAYLYHTRYGLNCRMVGENPAAADSLGISVTGYRYAHLAVGGALCGIAGGYLSLVYVPAWQDSLVAGRGWIAVALVIFAQWNPYRALVGALFFGGLDIIGFRLQRFDLPISTYIFDVLPYLMTVIVLILSSSRKSGFSRGPEALGVTYFREQR